jgi:hypothetical protein
MFASCSAVVGIVCAAQGENAPRYRIKNNLPGTFAEWPVRHLMVCPAPGVATPVKRQLPASLFRYVFHEDNRADS